MNYQGFCMDFLNILATLYMAINEIRASAKETGMRFWEYGTIISFHFFY